MFSMVTRLTYQIAFRITATSTFRNDFLLLHGFYSYEKHVGSVDLTVFFIA